MAIFHKMPEPLLRKTLYEILQSVMPKDKNKRKKAIINKLQQ